MENAYAWLVVEKLGGIDGDPVLRGTRIRATWEYVSSVEEWYLEICRGGQETLGTSGGVLLPKTKLDQSRPNLGILCNSSLVSGNRLPMLCNRLLEEKSLEAHLLIACSGYETLCVAIVARSLVKESTPIFSSLQIMMAAQFIHDRVEMECLEGVWETLKGNARCRFRDTIRLMATSLRTVEWILPTPTPYLLVEPVQVIDVTSSEEDHEEEPEELPPEPAVDALDFLEGDEDPLPEVDSPEDVMSVSEADSTEESGPGGIATSGEFNPCTCRAPRGFQGPGPGRGIRLGAAALCWIYEHFPTVHTCVVHDAYDEGSPRARRWLTGKAHMTGIKGAPNRRCMDACTMTDVCWMPYAEHRGVRGFDLISSYTSQLRWGQIVVYVRLERVLWQFGYIQTIPPPPVCDSLTGDDIDDQWLHFLDHLVHVGELCVVPGQHLFVTWTEETAEPRHLPPPHNEEFVEPPIPEVSVVSDLPTHSVDLEQVINLRMVTEGTDLYEIMTRCLRRARGDAADGSLRPRQRHHIG
ncbi:hypothetical protein HKD37_14G040916 [Glycine soja]